MGKLTQNQCSFPGTGTYQKVDGDFLALRVVNGKATFVVRTKKGAKWLTMPGPMTLPIARREAERLAGLGGIAAVKEHERILSAENTSLADFVPDWLLWSEHHCRENSWKAYSRHWRLHLKRLAIAGKSLKDIRQSDLIRVQERLAQTPSLSNAVINSLGALFAHAIRRGIVTHNPRGGITALAVIPTRVHWMSVEDWRLLKTWLDNCAHDARDAVLLCVLTGCRQSDAAGITLAEIDSRNRMWNLSTRQKGKKEHPFPLHDDSVVRIAQRATMWACPASKKIGRMQSLLITAIKQTGVKHCSLHSLRRLIASEMYERTGDIYAVSQYLGHSSIETTKKYIAKNFDRQREAQRNVLTGLLGEFS